MRAGHVVADRFLLEELAGEGGMGSVYRAREIHSGKQVALKLLHGTGPASDQERFAREARVLAELHHPGIVRYVAHGFTRTGEPYLAMEWLEGQTLSHRLAHGRLPIGESVLLARRTAEALGATHAQGVVHRDIKPQNLFLPDGDVDRVKIVDFGIARRKIETRPVTRTNAFVGTPAYTAPEQARGSDEVSARADVFSLGCVLFECITGRLPFVGDNLMAVLVKILFDEAPHLSELRADVPPALGELVARVLCKDPNGRPADGAALAAELAALELLHPTAEPQRPQAPSSLTTGEQRLASVMLAGVAHGDGGGGPSLTLTPEEVIVPFERLRAIAAPLAARIDCLVDGSVIATFTAKGSASDQAIQAARCALSMRAALPEIAIVLATGRSMLDGRLVVGEAIDRAVELLREHGHTGAAGGPRRILLDDTTAGLIEARFELGGAPGALELVAERDAEEGIRTLLGKPTPCVGRDRELAVLDGIFHECVAEPVARAALVTGAAGMGKSRLRYEFLRALRKRGGPPGAEAPVDIWTAQGDPLRAGSPFGMVGQLLRRAAGLLVGEPLEVRQRKLQSRVARHVAPASAARVTELLGELTSTPFPDQDNGPLRDARHDPLLMGEHMKRAFRTFLAAECKAHPLLLVLEDLHWSDLPSVQLVEEALRALPEQPLMVLACARPEVHELFPKLWHEAGTQELRLAKLPRKAGERLVREVLGEAVSEEKVARVVGQAAGNALYLEELIRAVAADSKDAGKDTGKDALPGTVLAMVQSRLEALEPAARQVIRAASVFGEVFWGGGVATLLGGAQDTQRVDDWLAALIERELLARRGESKFPGEQEYMFRHALVREAAYEMLTDRDRAVGHRLAGAWLERRGEQDAMVLADHFERGEEQARAATFYGWAAEQALEANDAAAILQRADRALACGADGELRGTVQRFKAEAHFVLRFDLAEAEACDVDAMRLLPRGSPRWFRAVAGVALAAFHRGKHDRLLAMVEELDSPAEPRARVAQVAAIALVVRMLLRAGELARAERLFATLAALQGEVAHDLPTLGHVQAALAERALFAGEPAAARAALEACIEHFERAGYVTYLQTRRMSAAMTLIELGQYARAEAELRAVLGEARLDPSGRLASVVKCRLALALARRGALQEARALAQEAVAAFQAHNDRFYESLARSYLALLLSETELFDAATREAEQAARVCEARARRCAALGILAHVRLRQGLSREAHQAAAEAMQLLEPLGGLEEGEALVRLVFAEALDAIGERAAARAALSAAAERLLARAARIDDPAWRASFLEEVPENARTLELARQLRSAPDDPRA
ncbi:MAG TPA: protein kinase [Kofleriaceae bacterium]|nr:protein kinase [Kofleriaceae bacterium]